MVIVAFAGARDRTGVRRADRRVRGSLGGIQRGRRVVLEVGQRRMLGVRGEPAVDEGLDDLRAAERAANEVSAALGLEVADRLGVLVALPRELDLALDLLVGHVDTLGLGDLREDEQDLRALLGARPE